MRTGGRHPVLAIIALGVALCGSPSPGAAASVCAKLQYKVAAAGAKAKAACYAKAAGSGSPVDPTCLAIAEEKLAGKWNRTTSKGDCPTNADAADAQAVVDAFIAGLAGILEPPTESHCCARDRAAPADPPSTPPAAPSFSGRSVRPEASATVRRVRAWRHPERAVRAACSPSCRSARPALPSMRRPATPPAASQRRTPCACRPASARFPDLRTRARLRSADRRTLPRQFTPAD